MGWRAMESSLNAGVRAGLGDPVLYSPLAGGGPISIRATFSEYFEEASPQTGLGVVTQRPNIWLVVADLPGIPVEGDRFEFEGRTFIVEEPRSDGSGATLLLARAE